MAPTAVTNAPKPPRLLDQVRDKLRKLHYSPRTEDAYIGWIMRFMECMQLRVQAIDFGYPITGRIKRHHIDPSAVQKAMQAAVRRAGIAKRATPHTLRHCFTKYLLQAGYDIRTVQELMGHRDVSTTQIYTHVLQCGGSAVRSPVDALLGGPASVQAPMRAPVSAPVRAAT